MTKTQEAHATGPKPAVDVEVVPSAGRRFFTAAYKRRIVLDASTSADVGALLRREGLYSSHLSTWRKEVAQRELDALAPKKRGPKPKTTAAEREIAELRREVARLTARAERAELLVDIQKKVSALLGIPLATLPADGEHS